MARKGRNYPLRPLPSPSTLNSGLTSHRVNLPGSVGPDVVTARKVARTKVRTLTEIKKLLELHLIPVFAQRPVEDIRCAEILDIIGRAYAHRSPVPLNKYLSYIKTVFKFGVDHDLIEKKPLRQ